jgi:hypothetical protein
VSQANQVIDGAPNGGAVIAAINAFLAAILTQNSGASAPSVTNQPVAYQLWADTTTGMLKQRNAANTAWITLGPLAGLLCNSVTRNLRITHAAGGNTMTQVTVNWDALTVGGTFLGPPGTAPVLNTATASGNPNALETGSWATNTWYALHAMTNEEGLSAGSPLFAVLASTKDGTPGNLPTLPSPYTRSVRIGWLKSDVTTATNLLAVTQTGPHALYDCDEGMLASAAWPVNSVQPSLSTTYTTADFSSMVPPGIVRALLSILLENGGTSTANAGAIVFRPAGSSAVGHAIADFPNNTNFRQANQFWTNLSSTRTAEWCATAGTMTTVRAFIGVHGWFDPAVMG